MERQNDDNEQVLQLPGEFDDETNLRVENAVIDGEIACVDDSGRLCLQ